MMDTYKECVEIVNRIIVENNIDVAIVSGDESVFLPNIDIEKKIILFPYLQESLLILDEIGTADQFRSFYLSLLMLQNDDYESGNELMDNLAFYGMPECTDAKALYKSILVKQVFILLHELGHYYYKYDEIPSIFRDYFSEYCKMLDEFHKNREAVEKEKAQMLEMSKRVVNDVTFLKDYFDEFDYKNRIASYINERSNVDESAADLFASFILLNYLPSRMGFSYNLVVKSVFGAINYIHTITSYRNFVDGICDSCQYSNSLSIRLGFLKTITAIFDPYEYSHEDIFGRLVQLISDLPSIEKYILKWREGNINLSDSISYQNLKNRIEDYTNSVKGLYQ